MSLNEAQIFWKNVEKIKDNLLMDDAQFAAELQMDLKEFKKISGSKSLLPLDRAFIIAEKMNFHFEDLFKTDFQLKVVCSNSSLLDRYNYAKYSQTKPIMSIVNYLEQTRGPRAKVNVLRKFQLSEDFLLQNNNTANVFLVADIAKYIQSNFNFTNDDFVLMGQTTPFLTNNDFLRSKLTGHITVQNMFSYFFDECTHLFDKNTIYQLEQMTDEFAIIAAIPKKEVIEELEIKLIDFGSDPATYNRAGIISSMTMFQYNANAPVKKISCIYHGDKIDRYLLDLSQFKKARPSLRLVH